MTTGISVNTHAKKQLLAGEEGGESIPPEVS